MKKILKVGIDFGTSTTVVRVLVDGSDTIDFVKDDKGNSVIPTIIFQRNNGKKLYGERAEKAISNGSEGLPIRNFKMDLLDPDEIKRDKAKEHIYDFLSYIYELYSNCEYSFPEHDETQVLISCPAKWPESLRTYMKETVKQVGFGDNVNDISEPIAASIFSIKKHRKELLQKKIIATDKVLNVLMADLGAGTSDVTIFQLTIDEDGHVKCDKTLSYPNISNPNTCGGREIDDLLAKDVLEKCGLSLDPQLFPAFAAKKWKEDLVSDSLKDEDVLSAPNYIIGKDGGNISVKEQIKAYKINRNSFETLTSSHWEALYSIIRGAVMKYKEKCNIGAEDIDLILLTGGHSLWYCVEDLFLGIGVNGFIGKDYKNDKGEIIPALNFKKIKENPKLRIIREANPQETVANGLCLQDSLIDVTTLSCNNVWVKFSVNEAESPKYQVVEIGDVIPLCKEFKFSMKKKHRLVNTDPDIYIYGYSGETLANSKMDCTKVKLEKDPLLLKIFVTTITLGLLLIVDWWEYKCQIQVSIDSNNQLDYCGKVTQFHIVNKDGKPDKPSKVWEFKKNSNLGTLLAAFVAKMDKIFADQPLKLKKS